MHAYSSSILQKMTLTLSYTVMEMMTTLTSMILLLSNGKSAASLLRMVFVNSSAKTGVLFYVGFM
jgi:hypothetical protein